MYTGSSSEYLQQQDPAYYNKSDAGNKWGWFPANCSDYIASICEVPRTSIACPVSWVHAEQAARGVPDLPLCSSGGKCEPGNK